MFKSKSSFTGFSVDNLAHAKKFYTEVLGLELAEEAMGMRIMLPGGGTMFGYEKSDHQPATYTMLNFIVDDINNAVDDLASRGVQFERYDDMPQDEKGILRGKANNMGPDIAWFKDPAGNILAVLQN